MKKIMLALACCAMIFVSCKKGIDGQISDFENAVAEYEKLVEAGKTGDELTKAEKNIEELSKAMESIDVEKLTEAQQMQLFGIAMRYAGAKMKASGEDLDSALEEASDAIEEVADSTINAAVEEAVEEVTAE